MLVARLVLALALFSVACGEETVVAPHETADPVEYLDEALDIIETRALNRDEVTWDSARTVAHQLAHDADTPSGTYDAITFALRQLGDNHSFLLPASQAGALDRTSTVDESQLPRGEILDDRVAGSSIYATTDNDAGNMWPMLVGIGPLLNAFGVSTGNTAHPLSDGAMLVLTEVRFADRAGEIYGDRLAPDEPTSPSTGARVAAQTWLAEAAGC